MKSKKMMMSEPVLTASRLKNLVTRLMTYTSRARHVLNFLQIIRRRLRRRENFFLQNRLQFHFELNFDQNYTK